MWAGHRHAGTLRVFMFLEEKERPLLTLKHKTWLPSEAASAPTRPQGAPPVHSHARVPRLPSHLHGPLCYRSVSADKAGPHQSSADLTGQSDLRRGHSRTVPPQPTCVPSSHVPRANAALPPAPSKLAHKGVDARAQPLLAGVDISPHASQLGVWKRCFSRA